MKAVDWIGMLVAGALFISAIHAAARSPRWWEPRRAEPAPTAFQRLPLEEVATIPATAGWSDPLTGRGLFSGVPPAPPAAVATSVGERPSAAAEPSPSIAADSSPKPRFELVGCAETSRGWAALVRDRWSGQTAVLCVGDVEPRWKARLVALRFDPRAERTEFSIEELPVETTNDAAEIRVTADRSVVPVETTPAGKEAL